MSLVAVNNDFGEYYNELVSKPRSLEDYCKNLKREELGDRRRIEEDEGADFRDMLHVAAVWISRKKAIENGTAPKMDRRSLALYNRQNEIWFPTAPPKMVEPQTRRLVHGFPKSAYQNMCDEEAELRRWHHGVEAKLREHIEQACQESYYILTCFEKLYAEESRARARAERDEQELRAGYGKQMFLVAPPDYYRRITVERFGIPERIEVSPTEGFSLEDTEAYLRAKLAEEEESERRKVHQPLVDALEVQLFAVHHKEICDRETLEEEERAALSLAIVEQSRASCGMLYYQSVVTALHTSPHRTPVFTNLCSLQLATMQERAAAFQQTVADAKKAYEADPPIAWEHHFPDAAKRSFAVAEVTQTRTFSTTSSESVTPPPPPPEAFSLRITPRAEQPPPAGAEAPPQEPPQSEEAAAAEPIATSAPLPAATGEVEGGPLDSSATQQQYSSIMSKSSMKKTSANESEASGLNSAKEKNSVHFSVSVDVVTIDPATPHSPEQAQEAAQAAVPAAAAKAPGAAADQEAARAKKPPRPAKKRSFHAFESDSDNECSA